MQSAEGKLQTAVKQVRLATSYPSCGASYRGTGDIVIAIKKNCVQVREMGVGVGGGERGYSVVIKDVIFEGSEREG